MSKVSVGEKTEVYEEISTYIKQQKIDSGFIEPKIDVDLDSSGKVELIAVEVNVEISLTKINNLAKMIKNNYKLGICKVVSLSGYEDGTYLLLEFKKAIK